MNRQVYTLYKNNPCINCLHAREELKQRTGYNQIVLYCKIDDCKIKADWTCSWFEKYNQ